MNPHPSRDEGLRPLVRLFENCAGAKKSSAESVSAEWVPAQLAARSNAVIVNRRGPLGVAAEIVEVAREIKGTTFYSRVPMGWMVTEAVVFVCRTSPPARPVERALPLRGSARACSIRSGHRGRGGGGVRPRRGRRT